MKTILTVLFMLMFLDAQAMEIQVKKMSKSRGYDERYELKTNSDEKVVLDCQSFVQGLFFGENDSHVIMLQEWECDELTMDMSASLKKRKKHCLQIDFERSVLDQQQTCL